MLTLPDLGLLSLRPFDPSLLEPPGVEGVERIVDSPDVGVGESNCLGETDRGGVVGS